MYLTNLEHTYRVGIFAPCIAPGSDMPKSGWVLIDHETENHLLAAGDPDAWARADAIYMRMRDDGPKAMMAFYGWPYPKDDDQALAAVEHYKPVLAICDWLCPTCYITPDGSEVQRGAAYSTFRRAARLNSKSVYGAVCDWTLDAAGHQSRECTDEDLVRQCVAAKLAGSRGLYVWSGLPWRAWAAKTYTSADPKVRENAAKAWAELLGMWGFRGEQTESNINTQYVSACRRLMSRFSKAWRKA